MEKPVSKGITETPEEQAAYWDWYRSLPFREKVAEDGYVGVMLHTRAGNAVLFFGQLAVAAALLALFDALG